MANEFISRKELIKNFWEFTNGGKQRYLIPEEIWEMVELAPTADVVEVVHASWEQVTEYDKDRNAQFTCTNCGARDVHAKKAVVAYCWNCGAKMDGKKVE